MLTPANGFPVFRQTEAKEHGCLRPSSGFCARGGTLPPTPLGFPPPTERVDRLDVEPTKRKVH